jgi:hypothetical protein
MEPKKLAMILGIMVLLPLFLGLFVDALYSEPRYDKYCNDSKFPYPMEKEGVKCNYTYTEAQRQCDADGGMSRTRLNDKGCSEFYLCDYCNKAFSDAQAVYNRNLFLILAPMGFIVVVIGIYLAVDYIGAGLMLGGLATMFYATLRYFSDMSKMLRAMVILVELLLIMWIGYKKIGVGKESKDPAPAKKPAKKRKK